MKIVIASYGRAHLLDCARELQKRGHDVIFYSITTKNNLKEYGLNHGGISLLKVASPFIILHRIFKNNFTLELLRWFIDKVVCFLLPECNIFIAQSPNYTKSIIKAKRKYNAITILDRGTSHVKSFNRILKSYGIKEQSEAYQKKDEYQYQMVDYIAIASDFCYETFQENSFDMNKIFLNPYGVSTDNFFPTICTEEFDCIIVGQWSKRKGSDIVIKAFNNTEIKILHVGSIIDVEFPESNNFTHINSIAENQLIKFYKRSKIFLFPSREDGFGLVLSQALMCGLPIVCSKNCGGRTLKRLIKENQYIYILQDLTPEALRHNVEEALALANNKKGILRNYISDEEKEILSWHGYGTRYNNFLKNIEKKHDYKRNI